MDRIELNMVLFYNILTLVVIAFGFPLLLPLALLSEKRRKTAPYRLGLCSNPDFRRAVRSFNPKPFWIHALSVGETLSAVPLVKALALEYGKERILFSVSTLTGFEIARQQLTAHVASIFFFPYDLLFSVHHRIRQVRPAMIVIVETDIWPNFLLTARKRRIPVVLINARLSADSFRGYQRLGGLFRPALSVFNRIGVQTDSDAGRFNRLGVAADKIVVTGNIKFHQAIPESPMEETLALKRALGIGCDQKILLAGSTHPEEEGVLLEAFLFLKTHYPELMLIIAPRNPKRALGVKRACLDAGFSARTMTDTTANPGPHPPDVLVVNLMGRLRDLYAICDMAFVGGSLGPCGGHNPLEPAAYAKPVLFGPDMTDFQQIADQLRASGAALTVPDGPGLSAEVMRLLRFPEEAVEMGKRALAVFSHNQGALEKSLKIIADLI